MQRWEISSTCSLIAGTFDRTGWWFIPLMLNNKEGPPWFLSSIWLCIYEFTKKMRHCWNGAYFVDSSDFHRVSFVLIWFFICRRCVVVCGHWQGIHWLIVSVNTSLGAICHSWLMHCTLLDQGLHVFSAYDMVSPVLCCSPFLTSGDDKCLSFRMDKVLFSDLDFSQQQHCCQQREF